MLRRRGIELGFVTLHVGLDTFKPVDEDTVEAHQIHTEWCTLPSEVARQINEAKLAGRRVIAVGTKIASYYQARGVVFQRLEFEQVELRSDPIQVRIGALLRSRSFQLEEAFSIRGLVVFSAAGLRRTLGTPQWHELGDQVAEELLGISPLGDLRIEEDRLILQANLAPGDPPLERAVRVRAVEGTLELSTEQPEPLQTQHRQTEAEAATLRLPMDPNVQLERAALGGGLLELHGGARVLP